MHRRAPEHLPASSPEISPAHSLETPAEAALRDRLCIVLVRTRNPLNIGAAARAISNFGFSRMRVVNPYEPSFREARSATGASDVLAGARVFPSLAQAVADCSLVVGATAVRNRQLHQPLHTLHHAAGLIRGHLAAAPAALLFGSERVGLSTSDLSHCHFLLRISTSEKNISMNLGQAVAVCLYELSRPRPSSSQPASPSPESSSPPSTSDVSLSAPALSPSAQNASPSAPGVPSHPLASSAELERLTQVLLEALRSSRYLKPNSPSADEDKLRRLILRLHLSQSDATLCLGMLRQILWKFHSI